MHVRATLKLANEDMIRARESKGLTMKDLAAASGVSLCALYHMQRFKFSEGTRETWIRRADAVSLVLEVPSEALAPPEMIGEEISPLVRVAKMPPQQLLTIRDRAESRLTLPDPSEGPEYEELQAGVRNALKHLTSRERQVIIRRYGLDGEGPRTLRDVGKEVGVTAERVRMIEHQALAHMRRLGATRGALSVDEGGRPA